MKLDTIPENKKQTIGENQIIQKWQKGVENRENYQFQETHDEDNHDVKAMT